jgi:hypothetical protein
MTARIRTALMTIVLAMLTAGSAAAGEPQYGVCRTAIQDYVENTLKLTVKSIDLRTYAERAPSQSLFDTGDALVYVEECDGFLSFEVRETWSVCEHLPHYGSDGSSYIRYEGAWEGCSRG